MMSNICLKNVGIAKECESPENPDALEKRVALIPRDVKKLIEFGCDVSVEQNAGVGIGYSDQDYIDCGAKIQSHVEIYQNKDLIVKFKGAAIADIPLMEPGTTLFCMAHMKSYPGRAKLLKEQRIITIAMEEVREHPKYIPDPNVLGKVFMQRTLDHITIPPTDIHINILGYSELLIGAIKRAGNRSPLTLSVWSDSVQFEDFNNTGPSSLYFYDSKSFKGDKRLLSCLKQKKSSVLDIQEFISQQGSHAIQHYRETHPPFDLGGRKIQCLHETGRAGCRYGFQLVTEVSQKIVNNSCAKVVILGYGNVGMGAIHEAYERGVKKICILGRRQTAADVIETFIRDTDIIVNGAEQPVEFRGKNFLITNHHIANVLQKGTAVIDLVGGSPTNRSPVEPVLSCTFLTEPYFEQNSIIISALWGWPMMGMAKESAIKYSSQIINALVEDDKLVVTGAHNPSQSIKDAIVC